MAEKGADVRRQAGAKSEVAGIRQEADHLECSMDMESRNQEYYRARGAAIDPSFKGSICASRRRMLRGRSFVRIWKGRTGR